MKTIGRIQLQTDDEGNVLNADYAGGFIVELTERETEILGMLDDAASGKIYTWMQPHLGFPKDKDLSKTFYAIYIWLDTKFSINEMKQKVEDLERVLVKEDE